MQEYFKRPSYFFICRMKHVNQNFLNHFFLSIDHQQQLDTDRVLAVKEANNKNESPDNKQGKICNMYISTNDNQILINSGALLHF